MNFNLVKFDQLMKHDAKEIIHPERAIEELCNRTISGESNKRVFNKVLRDLGTSQGDLQQKLRSGEVVLKGDTSYGEGIFKQGTREYSKKNLATNMDPQANHKFKRLLEQEYRAYQPAREVELEEVKYTPEPPVAERDLSETWILDFQDELADYTEETTVGIPFKITTDTGVEITGTIGESDGRYIQKSNLVYTYIRFRNKKQVNEYITFTLYPEGASEKSEVDQLTNALPILRRDSKAPPSDPGNKYRYLKGSKSLVRRMLGNTVKIYRDKDSTRARDGSPTNRYRVRITPSPGVILFPSYTTPALVADGGKAILKILLLTNDDFYQYKFRNDKDTKDKQGGPYCRRAVNAQLRIKPWVSRTQESYEKPFLGVSVFGTSAPIKENITVHYLGEMENQRTMVKDKEEKPWGIIREETAQFYHHEKYKHLFEINIENAFRRLPTKSPLFDVAWAALTDPAEYVYYSQSKDPNANTRFIETQNIHVTEYLEQASKHIKRLGLYKISNATNRKNIHQLKNSPGVYLTRHPAYISDKEKLNVAQLTDVHVSSRQHIYTLSKAQMIPGASTKDSPYLGEMVNINALSLLDLLNQIGAHRDIDMLVITGDLIDHVVNLDPEAIYNDGKEIKSTGDIWQYMTAAKENDETFYPRHIDNMIVLSLLEYFMQQYKKPVIMISGNHEAYEMPYGISPRISDVIGSKKLMTEVKANVGIPADHNLTITEAMLLYGEDFAHIHKSFNFNADIYEWFYKVFTPLSDFIISYNEQSFTGLEWGNNEEFVGSMIEFGGSLPRANESLNDEQLELVKGAIDLELTTNILLTHFTLVNFSLDLRIGKEKTINTVDVSFLNRFDNRKSSDEGSFHRGRATLYKNYILNRKFQYAFSGHSHRAALYYALGSSWLEPGFNARGCLPEQYTQYKDKFSACTTMIVGASGGPIPKQNINNELAGQGMDCPQSTWVDMQNDTIHTLRCKQPQAKPRFAVALDYMEMVEKKKPIKYISTNRKHLHAGRFAVRFRKTFRPYDFIDTVKLHYLEDGNYNGFIGFDVQRVPNNSKYHALLANSSGTPWWKYLEDIKSNQFHIYSYFISIHFNSSLATMSEYAQYDFNSPWIYPVYFGYYVAPTDRMDTDTIIIERDKARSKTIRYKYLKDNYREYT